MIHRNDVKKPAIIKPHGGFYHVIYKFMRNGQMMRAEYYKALEKKHE